jgi:hypothetical protein
MYYHLNNYKFEEKSPYNIVQGITVEEAGQSFKAKRVCFIYGLSAYRAVNTLHIGCAKPVC